MVEGKWFLQASDITQPLAIRQAVFGRGRDALDAFAQQVVVFHAATPVGTARLLWQDGIFILSDIAVLEAYRSKGYGDLLVRLLLYKAECHHAKALQLQCAAALVPFFARYGFSCKQQTASQVTMSQLPDQAAAHQCAQHCGNASAPITS